MFFSRFLLIAFLLAGLCSACSETAEPDNPPNIILIMADDLGYGDLGCYGSRTMQTPQLDSLAANGLKFTDFHANAPVCTPTRAALLTGRYQQRAGLEGVIYVRGETRQVGMDTSEVTVAELLKDAGYQTAIMGKWHLGYKKEYNPVQQGFDEFYGYVSGNIDYHSHYDNAGIYDWWHNLDSIKEEGYVTDLITDHAVDFIDKNRDRPFFLYVSHESPHVPLQGRQDTAYRFPDRDFSYLGPVDDQERAYREMIEVMDEGIDHIMQKLRALDLEENTLVIFCSDNGGLEGFADNGALRGFKGKLWEGGIRVPAIAHWTGTIEPGETDATVLSFDFMPTFLALAKADKPANLALDGKDITPLLFGQNERSERTVFWRYRQQKVARKGDWKLIVSENDTTLYNLQNDLAEQNDLKTRQPERTAELLQVLSSWEADITAPQKTN